MSWLSNRRLSIAKRPEYPRNYANDYLTFEALQQSDITIDMSGSDLVKSEKISSVSYSLDKGWTWTTTTVGTTATNINIPTLKAGDKLLLKGIATTYSVGTDGESKYTKILSTGNIKISGNILSMLYGDNFRNQTQLTSSTCQFAFFFAGLGNKLLDVSNLILPATTLTNNCYNSMFRGCTSLTTAPVLPAKTLANNCYSNMFYGCTSLTTAPVLPATTLLTYCYSNMFKGCTSLATAPVLPAAKLADYCYNSMFNGCTSLATAPALSATTLASNCYSGMFNGCTSLTTAPVLPATTLANNCYDSMFSGCTTLTTAPVLPATTLANNCYDSMFSGCSRLNYIKALFTTTPSTTYTQNWVSGVAATGTFIKNPLASWTTTGVNGVPTGWIEDIIWPSTYNYFTTEAIDDSIFTLTIPSNKRTAELKYVEYSTDNGQNWTRINNVNSTQVNVTTSQISSGNSVKWRSYSVAVKDCIFSSTGRYNVSNNIMSLIGCVSSTTNTYIFENIFKNSTNLINANNLVLSSTVSNYCYADMFNGCTALITPPELPATTMANNCYQYMFRDCTALTTAPALPATTLATSCYSQMFQNCTSLATAPELPATTLATCCYQYMFNGCTSLTTAPALPATTLADCCYRYMFSGTNILPDCSNINFTSSTVVASGGLQGLFSGTNVTYNDLLTILPLDANNKPCLPVTTLAESCYSSMFFGCKALTTAPVLPATTLANYCYYDMFQGCTSLTTAPELPATTLASNCYGYMFYGCTALTTAPELHATTLASNCYWYMFQNCTSLTTAPVLPAKTLANNCYAGMFWNCSNLNYIKAMFTTTPSSTYTGNWVSGVSSAGTFVKNSAATWNVTGNNGVPSGWTVQTASS